MWADEFNVNHKMRLFNAKHERREHKLAPVVVEWMNATQLDGMRRPTIWNLTRTFKSSEIGWILRCIGSTELVFGPDHICTECRAHGTLQHCTSECELLPPDERVDMQSLLWDCDPTVKGDSGSSAKLEYKKLLRIAKRQLVECDTTQLARGDKLTVLWKGGLSKTYTVLGRGVTDTHHRVYDREEMRIKVLSTSLLSEQRRLVIDRMVDH